jgi:hypothetical protein
LLRASRHARTHQTLSVSTRGPRHKPRRAFTIMSTSIRGLPSGSISAGRSGAPQRRLGLTASASFWRPVLCGDARQHECRAGAGPGESPACRHERYRRDRGRRRRWRASSCPRGAGQAASRPRCSPRNQSRPRARSDQGFRQSLRRCWITPSPAISGWCPFCSTSGSRTSIWGRRFVRATSGVTRGRPKRFMASSPATKGRRRGRRDARCGENEMLRGRRRGLLCCSRRLLPSRVAAGYCRDGYRSSR